MARAAGPAAACLLVLSLAARAQCARLQAISQRTAPQMLMRHLLHAGHTPSGPQPFLESIPDTPTQEIERLINATAGDVSADSATQLMALITANIGAGASADTSGGTSLSADNLMDSYGTPQRTLTDQGLASAALAIVACEATQICQLTAEESSTDSTTPDDHATNVVKGVGAAALFLEALLGVLIPIFSRTKWAIFQPGHLLMSMMNCFAGGVFLTFGFMHFLGDAAAANTAVLGNKYNLCYFLAVIGFLTVFFVSRVLAPLLRQHPAPGSQASVPGGCCSSVPLPQPTVKDLALVECGAKSVGSAGESEGCSNCGCGADPSPQTAALMQPTHSSGMGLKGSGWIAPLVLWLGICIHALLEGMSMGLQVTKADVVVVLVALVSHKWVESVALSSRLTQQGASIWQVVLVLLPFALTVPVGVGIGVALSSVSNWVTLVFFGLIAGAFVYIALEIVLDDFSGPLLTRQAKLRRVLCFLAMLAGLTLVALLQMINDDPGS